MEGNRVLLVDATTVSPDRTQAVLTQLKGLFAPRDEVRVAVLLTEQTYALLPRGFDETGLTLERVSPDQVEPAVERYVSKGALVASPTVRAPLERWVAVSLEPTVEFGPADWRDRVLRSRVEPVPPHRRPLEVIARPEGPPFALPKDPHALHALAWAVATGDVSKVRQTIGQEERRATSPEGRATLALHLKVPAAATEEEWTRARERAAIRIPPKEWALGRLYCRYSGKSAVLWMGDELLLCNPSEDSDGPFLPALFEGVPTRRVEERGDASAIAAEVKQVVGALTEDDALADPFLVRHPMFAPDGEELAARRHALFGAADAQAGTLKSAPPVSDWRSALQQLLASVPLEAGLTIERTGNETAPRSRRPFIAAVETVAELTAASFGLAEVFPLGPVSVVRGKPLAEFDAVVHSGWTPRSLDQGARPYVLRPLPDALESRVRQWEVPPAQKSRPFEVAPDVWRQADDHLGAAVLSLRAALARNAAVTRPSGVGLLDLGNGLVARVRVSALVRPAAPSARLDYPVGYERFRTELLVGTLTKTLVTARAGDTDVTISVPHGMRFSGGRSAVEVTFFATALLGARATGRELGAVVDELDRASVG